VNHSTTDEALMQTLDIHEPGMPDLQFALLVTALCTSELASLNVPETLRRTIFDRCWVLTDESPPPRHPAKRVLNLRPWTEVTLEAIVETIRRVLTEAGINTLTWDESPRTSLLNGTVEAQRVAGQFPQHSAELGRLNEAPAGRSGISEQRRLLGEFIVLSATLSPALRGFAVDRGGMERELLDQVLKDLDSMRQSALAYLRWARCDAAFLEQADESEAGP
jgi:hypothetical protein